MRRGVGETGEGCGRRRGLEGWSVHRVHKLVSLLGEVHHGKSRGLIGSKVEVELSAALPRLR